MNDPVSDAMQERNRAFQRLAYIKKQTNDPDQIKKATDDLRAADTKRAAVMAAAKAAKKKVAPQQ